MYLVCGWQPGKVFAKNGQHASGKKADLAVSVSELRLLGYVCMYVHVYFCGQFFSLSVFFCIPKGHLAWFFFGLGIG